MIILTVTAKGQVTLKQELLRHLGIKPKQKINVDTLPDGRAVIQAAPEGRDIADSFGILALETLTTANNVVINQSAVETGLAILRAGGDFDDGVIANEGLMLGGETFVTFDRNAVAILKKHHTMQTRLLS